MDSSKVFFERAKGMKKNLFQILKFDKEIHLQSQGNDICKKFMICYGIVGHKFILMGHRLLTPVKRM